MSWEEARWLGDSLSDSHEGAIELIALAESNWEEFAFRVEPTHHLARYLIADGPAADDAFEIALRYTGHLQSLAGNFPAAEVTSHFTSCLGAHGLSPLPETEVERLQLLTPVDGVPGDLFFHDLAEPLDAYAMTVGRRLLGCDEGGDTYPFALVRASAFAELVGVTVSHWRFYDAGQQHARPTTD